MTAGPVMTARVGDSPEVFVALTSETVDVAAMRDVVSRPDHGACVWFEGVTRRMTGDRVTETLFYEAYEPMAREQLETLALEAGRRFELSAVAAVHRLGEVPVGQASIVLACSAPHRRGPLAAIPWMMDRIKSDVAIWKREEFADGTREWVHPQ